ncbi:MAG TPA: 2,3-bisphosphoglycerate-dependent phosphoglycerate mutase [Methanothrix sp.]|nr:2,3-bisphosphoglycerate-dependent phosphoglycerate mutase [Methanothrix sp.]
MAKLVLLRHGQSRFNEEGRFTGWMDIDLSERGRAEAEQAGWLMRGYGLSFDIAFSSSLKRAIRTMWIVLDEMDLMWIPALPCWRLNERFYGDLQGKTKAEVEKVYGAEQVRKWRRGYNERPPEISLEDDRYPGNDPRYKEVKEGILPRSESLRDTEERILPFWRGLIYPEIKRGKNVLVVSHGNCIRALVRYLEDISESDVENLEVGTARPRVYDLKRVEVDGKTEVCISDHYNLSSGNGAVKRSIKRATGNN